jgi:uncharacterized protein with GYD domain
MAKYLIEAAFTSGESLKAVEKEGAGVREAAFRTAVESLGGKLDCIYYALGQYDTISIIDMPDNVSAAALSFTISASGLMRTKTPALLTMAEGEEAFSKGVSYRPPG